MFYWKLNIDFIKFHILLSYDTFGELKIQCTVIQNGPYLVDFPWTQTVAESCLVSPVLAILTLLMLTSFSPKATSTLVRYPFLSKTKTTPVISIQLASSDCSTTWKCLLEWIWRLQVSAYLGLCAAMNLFLFILIDTNLQGSWRLLSNLIKSPYFKKSRL